MLGMSETAQDRGRFFEALWAKLFGVEVQKGSGSVWYAKLDVADSQILWSCKHTDAESFRVSRPVMKEAQEAVTGQGGVGGKIIPGLAYRTGDGELYVTLLAEDFLRLAESGDIQYVEPSKANAKLARSRVPQLLRSDPDG